MKILIIVLGLATYSCSQIPLYGWLSHDDYSYVDEVGGPLDSVDVEFVTYKSTDGLVFTEYNTRQSSTLYLLSDQSIYTDQQHYFYERARRISDNTYSFPSDTASAFFRKILPDKTYNFEILRY